MEIPMVFKLTNWLGFSRYVVELGQSVEDAKRKIVLEEATSIR